MSQITRHHRRSFLLTLFAAPLALAASMSTAAAQKGSGQAVPATPQSVSDFPDPKTLQSGDFIWPKTKGAIVPRTGQPSQDQRAFEAARERLLQGNGSTSGLSAEDINKLKSMNYEEFETLYFSGPAGRSFSIGGQTFSVGHVGIIEIDAHGVPYVIEAIPSVALKGNVIKTPYSDWLKGQSGAQVWHGRVRDLGPKLRKRIAVEAAKQLGKPYDFFNFDLNDDSGFYCSKLAWMSVWRATRRSSARPIAVDDDPHPRRPFLAWFSPKQLVNAKRIVLLHKPGEY
jgi:hypothetical protein